MSPITTHVLDTARGGPAAGVPVTLERGPDWDVVGSGRTGEDGRLAELGEASGPGTYRLRFDTAGYFRDTPAFFPEVTVQFRVERPDEHFHVPLLLSPFGYSTYRGS